ncbi:MAG TPA: 3-phosphoshikimate 1-carboxyvinyltransferase [Streptosporangiaceae bacterium]
MSTWHAPSAAGPVNATVRPPGSKSITNRALVLAALSEEPSVITGGLEARDTSLAVAALRVLGCDISMEKTGWRVTPGSVAPESELFVEVGNSGTCMRFLPAVAALTRATVRFDGDPRVRERPIGPMLSALRSAGVDVSGDAAPFSVHGTGSVRGGSVVLDASGSSQFVSGLLLSAARFDNGVEVRHEGPPVPSLPLIDMTLRMLSAAGVSVLSGDSVWRVAPGQLSPGTTHVEPDLMNTVPFLAAALVTGGTVVIPGWPRDSLQAASRILSVLGSMGGSSSFGTSGLTFSGTGTVTGITADLADVSEMAPVLTAVAAVASSPSSFTGLAHTRRHETDRLAAMAKELSALGGDVTELPDGLTVRPRPLAPGLFGTYDDHRLVMAAAVLGLAVPGLTVANPETAGKTFPSFMDDWAAMLGAA